MMRENIVPSEVEDQYNKASWAVHKKNYDYAIELLTHIINIKPDFGKGRQLLRLAEIKRFNENPPSVMIGIINKLRSSLHMIGAMSNKWKGDYHAAMSIYEDILKNDPKNTKVLLELGILLKEEGFKEASAVTLESIVYITEKNQLAFQLLGELYSDLGNYDRAKFCFEKVLQLRPHDADAERGLKNLSVLTTIDKSFEKKESPDLRIREITE